MYNAQANYRSSKFNCRVYVIIARLLMVAAVSIFKGQDVLWINSCQCEFLDLSMAIITQLGAGLLFFP